MATKRVHSDGAESDENEDIEISDSDTEEFSYVSVKQRKAAEQELAKRKFKKLQTGESISSGASVENSSTADVEIGSEKTIEKIVVPVGGESRKNQASLLDQHSELKNVKKENEISEAAKQQDEERRLLDYVAEKTALKAVQEIARNILYTDPIKTTWSCPKWLQDKYPSYHDRVRRKRNIEVDGEDCPPPITCFKQMKLPKCIVKALESKDIKIPTAIQVQALPVVLSGNFVHCFSDITIKCC